MTETLDPENLLLLYLAYELSPTDRKRLEQQLAVDEVLRAKLHELESAQQTVNDGLARLEEDSAPIHAGAISRRVGRVLRQELARPRAASPHAPASLMRIWPWLLPGAAAASILVAAAVWIDRQVGASDRPSAAIAATGQPPVTGPADASLSTDGTDRPRSNYALWMDSFRQLPQVGSGLADTQPFEDNSHVIPPPAKDDGAASQDPVSQYLLSSAPTPG